MPGAFSVKPIRGWGQESMAKSRGSPGLWTIASLASPLAAPSVLTVAPLLGTIASSASPLAVPSVDFVFLFCAVFPAYAPSYEARERPAYALQQLSIYGAIIVLLGYSQSSFLVESQPSFLRESHLSCCPLCATPRLVIPSQPLPRSS